MSEFYDDYKEWLSVFKIIREVEESDSPNYNIYGESDSTTPEEIPVYGIIEERTSTFVEISDRSKSEVFKSFICDMYDTVGNPIELKFTDKIKDPSSNKIYKIEDINSLLQHHYECKVQALEVS